MKKYIKSKQAESFRKWGLFVHKTPVVMKDSCNAKERVEKFVTLANNKIPPHLMKAVDEVLFGRFSFYEEQGVLSRCFEGKIYIHVDEDIDVQDMLMDFIHEVSHANEKKYKFYLDDAALKDEFVQKRKAVFNRLIPYHPQIKQFHYDNIDYDNELDRVLYYEIGLQRLAHFTKYIFVSPYSLLSFWEYIAEAMEFYLLEDREFLLQNCPVLYTKLKDITGDRIRR